MYVAEAAVVATVYSADVVGPVYLFAVVAVESIATVVAIVVHTVATAAAAAEQHVEM